MHMPAQSIVSQTKERKEKFGFSAITTLLGASQGSSVEIVSYKSRLLCFSRLMQFGPTTNELAHGE